MGKPGSDEIVTQKHHRAWSQRGGPSPLNQMRYAGPNEQYMMIDDYDSPVRGGIDPVYVHDPKRRGAYRLVGRSVSAPDFPTATITFMLKHGGVPWVDYDLTCPNNFYAYVGNCKRPDDKVNGWSDIIQVYSYGEATSRSGTGNTAQDSDDNSTREIEFQFNAIYTIGSLLFGEITSVQVEREVVDVVYGSAIECGNCGPSDDGTKRIYAVTKSSGAGSPGTPAEVIYTTDGGATGGNVNITGLGGTVDPTGIEIVGTTLIVLDTAGNGYWLGDLNPLTGVPTGTWTNVTAGFVASKQPTDMYVAGPNEVWFCGNGGYIYRSTDLASGVSVISAGVATTANLQRIHGLEETIVATGESGAIIKSTNRGLTFATTTTSPTSATLRALLVLDQYRYWIGTSGGKVYYTVNGGETFVEQTLPSGTSATVIDDIIAATDEVLYIAARTSTPTARLLTTWNGGETWVSSATVSQRIQGWATFNRANRLAAPRDVDATTAANYLVAGGLSGGGTDGALYLGAANKA